MYVLNIIVGGGLIKRYTNSTDSLTDDRELSFEEHLLLSFTMKSGSSVIEDVCEDIHLLLLIN